MSRPQATVIAFWGQSVARRELAISQCTTARTADIKTADARTMHPHTPTPSSIRLFAHDDSIKQQ